MEKLLEGDLAEAWRNANIFLDSLNEFYKQIDFDGHLKENHTYYQQMIRDVKKNFPDASFIPAMESFYNKS